MEPQIHEIATDDDPALKIVASEVAQEDIMSDSVQQLIADMIATMHHANGIGLAAPQIRVSKRIIVFYLPSMRDDSGEGVPLTVLINPAVTPLEGGFVKDYEGCLPVPNVRGKVKRIERN